MRVTPYTILIDQREKHPYTFGAIPADASEGSDVIVPKTQFALLPTGDYTADFCSGTLAIERKSKPDLYGTLLGFGGRRRRFRAELKRMSDLSFAAVVVEASLGDCITRPAVGGSLSDHRKRKILFRTVIGLQQDFPRVQWAFCDCRRLAEIYTFRFIARSWRRRDVSPEATTRRVSGDHGHGAGHVRGTSPA